MAIKYIGEVWTLSWSDFLSSTVTIKYSCNGAAFVNITTTAPNSENGSTYNWTVNAPICNSLVVRVVDNSDSNYYVEFEPVGTYYRGVPIFLQDMGFQYGVFPSLFKQTKTSGKYPTAFSGVDGTAFDMLNFQNPYGQVQDGNNWVLSADSVDDKVQTTTPLGLPAGAAQTIVFVLKIVSIPSTSGYIYGLRAASNNLLAIMVLSPSRVLRFQRYNTTSLNNLVNSTNTITLNTLTYLAVSVGAGSVTIRINTSKETFTDTFLGGVNAGPEAVGYPITAATCEAKYFYFARFNKVLSDLEWNTLVAKGTTLGLVGTVYGANGEYMSLSLPSSGRRSLSSSRLKMGF